MPRCPHCNQELPISQEELTDEEIARLPMGNQYDDNLTLLQWKTVKGAAIYYGVSDWVSKVDTTLSLDENIRLMEIHGTDMTSAGGRTVKELAVKEKAKTRWTK